MDNMQLKQVTSRDWQQRRCHMNFICKFLIVDVEAGLPESRGSFFYRFSV